jgi:hypothetical protein
LKYLFALRADPENEYVESAIIAQYKASYPSLFKRIEAAILSNQDN